MLWKPYISQAPMNIDPPPPAQKAPKAFFWPVVSVVGAAAAGWGRGADIGP